MINAYCAPRGWLFDDIREHLADAGAIPSDEPLPDADAWICIRSQELVKSPDLSRTVVQVHSLAWDHHTDYGLLREVGGIIATHPDQLTRAESAGVDLAGKRIHCGPIGAPLSFVPGSRPSRGYVVGWVGRPVRWQGRDIKRVDLYVETMVEARRQGLPVSALLVGERLREAAGRLRKAGIPTEYRDRSETPYRDYPALYRRMSACMVTAELEPGPLCVFEALACGVPVVGTIDGQAHHAKAWGLPLVLRRPKPTEMVRGLWDARDRCSARHLSRQMPYRLEDWARKCVRVAEAVRTVV